MREARAREPASDDVEQVYVARVIRCLELARNALEPLQPFAGGPAYSAACEHYRQAVYWCLEARRRTDRLTRAETMFHSGFDDLWDQADPEWLLRAAGNSQELRQVAAGLRGSGFVNFEELPLESARELAARLRKFAESLAKSLNPRHTLVRDLWRRRLTRCGGVLLCLAILGTTGWWLRDLRDEWLDIAEGKSWTASSQLGETCMSPDQRCAAGSRFFFHSQEEQNPWIVFDLGEVASVAGVKVMNRRDCCSERAVPLVVEVSEDQKTWTEVARRTQDFSTWRASFAPVRAKYVKLTVPRVSLLHLERVLILR